MFWGILSVAAGPDFVPAVAPNEPALTRSVGDAAIEHRNGGFLVVAPRLSSIYAATDPRYNWRFTATIFVYAPSPRGLIRAVAIHHDPADTDAARRAARLIARLMRLHREHFNRDTFFPRGTPEAHVWLSPQTPPGGRDFAGETRDKNVYFFAARAERTPIEWTRTIAHEWGHLTLPAARGYKSPEADAAGMLGERLYIKWLREDVAAANSSGNDNTDDYGLNLYHQRQIAPLIARFNAAGPAAPLLQNGTDTDAMDLYTGAVLATDEALGSAMMGKGLFSVLGFRPRYFLSAIAEAVELAPQVTLKTPAWIPLPRAMFDVTAAKPATLRVADRSPLTLKPSGTELFVNEPAWKWMRLASDASAPLTVTLRRRFPPSAK